MTPDSRLEDTDQSEAEEDSELRLPSMALLTMEELIARLQLVLKPDDLGLGLLLAHEFFRLVLVWERKESQAPPAVYRAALLAAEDGEFVKLRRIAQAPINLEHGIDAVILATTWSQIISRHLLPAKRTLVAPISKVLRDILSEPENPTPH